MAGNTQAPPTAQQIAAVARARGPALSDRLTLHSDDLAAALERQLELVAWDRELLVGRLQRRTAALHRTRPLLDAGPPVRVVERRAQPLEAIDVAWSWLRKGRAVRLERDHDACTAAGDLLRPVMDEFPSGALVVADETTDEPHDPGGVDPPGSRIAVVDEDADRELAAYVLARTALRRSGIDPRGIKRAYVAGDLELLQRHMRRLWVGVQVGPADDPESFAGPVPTSARDAFLRAHEQWEAHEGVTCWCPGGALQRAGEPERYLAPALFHTQDEVPELPLRGPMVVVVGCPDNNALRQIAVRVQRDGGDVVQIGGQPGLVSRPARHVRGALLVERLPPGLPEPRPV